MAVRFGHNEFLRRLLTAFTWGAVLLSCGRDVTAPSADAVRFARSLALAPVFPRAYQQVPNAFAVAPFTRVRVLFLRTSGAAALDTTVAFPASADSLALAFAVPLSSDAPAAGEPLSVLLYCLDAQGDTVFKGGPVPVVATTSATTTGAVRIPLAYAGVGANATSVRISPRSVTVASGDPFTFTATALDASGQAVPGTPIMFRAADPSIATLTSPAAGMGLATGAQGSTFIVAQLITGAADSAALTVGAKPASLQLVSGGGQTGAAGTQLAQPVVVRAAASDGSGVPGVAVSFAASGGGSVGAATVTTGAGGLAQTTWTLGATAGTQTLTATSAAITGAPLTVLATAVPAVAGVATKLAFTTQPRSAIAGSTLAPFITVSAEDASGSVATSFTGAVTLSVGAGPAATLLSGTATVNAVAGVATFTSASLTKAAAAYTLVASAKGLAPDSSTTFSIGAAGAARIAASSGDRQTGTAAAALGAPVAVIVTDVFGNPVSGFVVGWSAASGNGTLATNTSITNSAGVATDSWMLGGALGAQTVTASTSGLSGSPVAFSATATAGVATRLVITTAPSVLVAGAVIAPAIVVQAKDGLNNLQPSFSGNVTLSLGSNPAGGSLAGTTTVAAVNGVATFSDLSVKKAAAGYTLAAASGTLMPDTSTAFSVNAAAAATLAASGGTAQAGPVSATLAAPLSVTVTDAFGNPVSLVNVLFAIASGGGALSSTAVPTNAAGTASTNWTLGPATGTQGVTAGASGLTGSPVTFSATATAGGAARLAFTTQPANGIAGAALAPAIVVQARDAAGNPATGFTGTVSLALGANPGGASLGGGTSATAVAGVATFTNVSLTRAASGYTLVATASGLSSDTSAAFAVTNAAAAAIAASAGAAQTGLVASPLPTPLAVMVKDALGDPVAGAPVTWAVTAGGGGVSPASTTTNAQGVASTSWTLGTLAGTGTVTAASAGLAGSPVSFTSTAIASAATKLAIVTQPASVTAGAALSPAVVVQARDASNNLVTAFNGSVALSIGVNPGGATLGGTTTVNAVAGIATFTGVTLNRTGTGYTLVASAGGLTADNSAAFGVTNAAAATLAVAGGNNQSGAAALALTNPVSVLVTDALGNPVSGLTVTWSIATGGGSLGATSSATNAAGIASTTWTLGALAGAQGVTATATGLSGSPATFSATAGAGAAAKLVFTSQPGNVTAGVNLAPSVVVTVEDAAGNVASTYAGAVTLSLAANPGSTTLGGTATVNAVAGVATFTNVSLTKAAGGYRLGAASGTLAQDTSAPFTVGAAAAATMALSAGNSQSGAVGLALGSALAVTVTDAFGNPVAGVPVNWNVTGGGGSLGGATTNTNGSGVATNSWTLGSLIGTQAAAASGAGLSGSPATFTATGTAGAATKLVITSQPANGTAGASLALAVTAEDASGNVVSGFAQSVSLTFGANPGGGTLGGTTSVNAVAGVATFGGAWVAKAASGYTVVASASGLAAATSSAFDIGAAAPASITITAGSGQSGAIGLVLGSPLSVTVRDAYSNPTPNITVTWVVASGGGSLGSSTAQTDASGVATDSWTLGTVLGGQSATATAAGLASSPVTFSATGIVGAAAKLVMSALPASTIAGALIGPSVTVTAEDASGNVATSFSGIVQMALGANPGGGALGGTAQVNAVAGVATFTGLSIVKAAAGYTLVASASGVTAATSGTLTIAAAAANAIAISGGNNQSGVIAQLLGTPLAVSVTDQYANPVGSVAVTWAVTAGGGTLGTTSSQTNTSGVATNATWTLGTVLGAQSVTATAAGLASSPVTFSVTGLAGAAARLVMSALPASTVAGALIGPSIVVTAEDANGDVSTSFAGAVQLAFGANPGTATLGGTTSVTAVAGVATFGNVSVVKAATGYTLVASASGLTAVTSGSFDIGAAAPASITVAGGNNQSGVIALALGSALTVAVKDAYANPVPSVAVTWAVASGGGSLGSGSAQTNASGVATDTWTLGTLLGAQAVTATAAGLTSSPVTFSATGLVGSATRLVMSTLPASTIAGAVIGPSIVVTAEDASNNVVTSFTGAVQLALGSNPGGATLGGTASVNAVAGVATFSGVSIVKAAAGYTLVASASGLSSATSGSLTIAAAAANAVAITSGNGQSAVVAQLLGTPLTVSVTDQYGNPVPSVAVAWSVASGGGSLGTASSQTDASGIATNASWTLGTLIGAQAVTATAAGLASSPLTFGATGVAAAAAKLVLSAVPASTVAGTTIGPAIVATVEDSYNNVATSFSGAVSLAFGANPGGGTLAGTTAVNAVAGVATFSTLSIAKAASGYTLVASASGLTSATSSALAIVAGAASAIGISSGNNQPGTVAQLTGAPLAVSVTDQYANPVPNVTVAWGVASGGGSMSVATSQTNSSGIATNASWTLGTVAGGQNAIASAAGLAGSPVTFTVASVAGAAVKLVLGTQPGNTIAGVNLAPSLVATAEDQYDNVATAFSGTVSLAFGANPGGDVIHGTASVNAVNGVATFANVSIQKAAAGYTLVASASGLSPVTTGTFSINAAAPASIAVNGGNNQSGLLAILGILLPTPLSVLVTDAFGNPVSGYVVSWAVTLGGATLANSTSQTNSSGIATDALTLTGLLGGLRQVTATVVGVAGSALFSATGLL